MIRLHPKSSTDHPMARVRRAVIDVGTNSVKLLVADVEGSLVEPLLETSEQTRLGQGFYQAHLLQPEAIEHTARTVARFALQARDLHSARLTVIATSAARDALNQQQLRDALQTHAGLPMRIITGEQEAEWAFQGVTTDPALEDHRLLILDVGGGSTEFIVGEKGHHSFRQSFAVGSVRLLELLHPSDPPSEPDLAGCRAWLRDFFLKEIGPNLKTILSHPHPHGIQLVGTGGTTTILARMELRLTDFNRDRIDGTRLSRQQVFDFMTQLWSLPLSKRKQIVGLPPNRADIILMGTAICEAAIQCFDFPDLYVTTRGMRFGALMQESEI